MFLSMSRLSSKSVWERYLAPETEGSEELTFVFPVTCTAHSCSRTAFATNNCMSQYPNTLGLIVANGAISTIDSTAIAPMILNVI